MQLVPVEGIRDGGELGSPVAGHRGRGFACPPNTFRSSNVLNQGRRPASNPADGDAEGAQLGRDGREGVRVVGVNRPAGEVQAERAAGPGQRGGAGVTAKRGRVVAEHPPVFAAAE